MAPPASSKDRRYAKSVKASSPAIRDHHGSLLSGRWFQVSVLIGISAFVLPSSAALAWCIVIASAVSIAALPRWAFHLRYPLLAAEESNPEGWGFVEWLQAPPASDNLDDSLAPFVENGTALLVREGYTLDAESPIAYLNNEAALRKYFGQQELTVEAKQHGSKHFAFGAVEYRKMTMASFLDARKAAAHEEELYLVQQPIPAADVSGPAWLRDPRTQKDMIAWESVNLWMSGSADGNETSACHLDVADNLHVMLRGSKTFVLVPPSQTRLAKPVQPSDGLGAFESPYSSLSSAELRLLASSAPHSGWIVTLHPGDVLFIPRYWWHEVRVEPTGMPATSLNFWFRNGFVHREPLTDELNQLNLDLYLEARSKSLGTSFATAFAEEMRRLWRGPLGLDELGLQVTGYTHNPETAEAMASGSSHSLDGSFTGDTDAVVDIPSTVRSQGCSLESGSPLSPRCDAVRAAAMARAELAKRRNRPACLELYAGEGCATRAVELIPLALRDQYTMGGHVPVLDWMLGAEMAADLRMDQNALGSPEALNWTESVIQEHLIAFTRGNILQQAFSNAVRSWADLHSTSSHAGVWDIWETTRGTRAGAATVTTSDLHPLLQREPYPGGALLHTLAFEAFPVRGKKAAVVGSASPWIEAILLNSGAESVTTVEYRSLLAEHRQIRPMTYPDFMVLDEQFDVICSFSSLEHSGLGRYGDELAPDGDIEVMRLIWERLTHKGLLYWGAPVGQDALLWNAMRIYGKLRLERLWKGFEQLQWFGHDKSVLSDAPLWEWANQPLVVLRKMV